MKRPACGRTAKMGPAWPPLGGSSKVWEQRQRRPPPVSPLNVSVKVMGPRERLLLMILTPELADKGRHCLGDRLTVQFPTVPPWQGVDLVIYRVPSSSAVPRLFPCSFMSFVSQTSAFPIILIKPEEIVEVSSCDLGVFCSRRNILTLLGMQSWLSLKLSPGGCPCIIRTRSSVPSGLK